MTNLLKKKWVWGVAVIAVGSWYFFSGESTNTNIEFQTQALSRGDIESIVNTAGTISPTITVQVGSEVSGLISEMSADFNSQVTAGQVLARIDDRDIRVQLRQREADLETAKANLVQAQASLVNAETQLEFSRNEYERVTSLFERNLVSQADVERANNAVRSAEASLEQAKSNIVSSNASILQREAQLEQTQIDLERTYIKSPVDGVVLNRLVDLGQAVSANQSIPTLFEVAQDLSAMQIEASIDEADIGKVTEGMAVRFRVDAYPQRSFTGEIAQVRKAATTASNVVTYKVIIAANNPGEILLPGMTANVDIILGRKTDVLRAPNAALRFSPPASAIPEESAQQGGNGGGMDTSARVDQLAASLSLTNEQRDEVTKILEEQAEAMREMAEANAGGAGFGGFNRGAMANIRSRMDNDMKLVLTDEQYATYQSQQRQGGGRGGNAGGQQLSPGEIWILDERGQLVRVAIRTGLADAEYTEIVTEQLQEGDEVIFRAQMATQ